MKEKSIPQSKVTHVYVANIYLLAIYFFVQLVSKYKKAPLYLFKERKGRDSV